MKSIGSIILIAGILAFIACGNSFGDDSGNNSVMPDQEFIDRNKELSREGSSAGEAAFWEGSDRAVEMDKQLFLDRVFNFEDNPETWVFEGVRPAIVYFYADWCAPCRRVGPIMEELAADYQGKVDIYKVDTEKEKELPTVFRITSIPAMIFIPEQGQPTMYTGAFHKARYLQLVNKHFDL